MNRLKIAYLLPVTWKSLSSGVFTFVRLVVPCWQNRYDCHLSTFVEIPSSSGKETRAVVLTASEQIKNIAGRRLTLGYLQMLCQEIKKLLPMRHQLKKRLILSNDFGAELMPIALRILCPFNRLVAIAHTHPNMSNNDFWVRRVVERLCYWSCSAVVFNSVAMRDMWAKKIGHPMRKGVVVHYGMDVSSVQNVPTAYPKKTEGVIDVVCVGLFYKWKGQLALIDEWQEIMAACSVPLRLIFVGGGAVFDLAVQKAIDNGIYDHVVFLGQQPNGADFFNGADIAIHYPVEPEAFGLVLLEAMGRGKPVIAPAHGGANEIVVDGVTGFLVEPGGRGEDIGEKLKAESRKLKKEFETEDRRQKTEDGEPQTKHQEQITLNPPQAANQERSTKHEEQITKNQEPRTTDQTPISLVEAVCRLAEDADLRKRMGAAGRERVRTEFSVEKMLEGYDRVFRELAR